MSVYPFIEAEKAGQRSVNRACAVMKVSRAAYYEWRRQQPSRRAQEDRELSEKVQAIFDGSRRTYGAPRVHQALRQEGTRCARKRVARLMAERNLQGRHRRRWQLTTVADPEAKIAAEDLIGRQFEPAEIDVCWAGDITYVRTWEGWLYLASVIDLGSRRVVGWAMADHMRADLVCEALRMAINQRRPKRGLIFHSDRGSQYTSKQFTRLLTGHGIRQSLSRPRQCWDNAVMESFYSTLKVELIHRHAWPTRAEARQAVFEFVEVFYNRQRLHSSLGYTTPAAYETCLASARRAGAA